MKPAFDLRQEKPNAMKQPPIKLIVTIARPSDFGSITRLCNRAVGRGDYVHMFLQEAVADKGLFLAWNGKELVGMANFEKCLDGSGWLSMARTDPAWRGKGVAGFLQKRIAAYARQRGISYLRLWTTHDNRRSLNAIRKGGFTKICEAAHIYANLRRKKGKQRIRPTQLSTTQLRSLLKSRYVSQMNGYIGYKWYFVKADKTLPRLRSERQLYNVDGSSFVLARTERIRNRVGFSVAFLDGPIRDSLRSSRETARLLGGQAIRAYVPYDSNILRAARELGFKRAPWGRHCLVFEKRIS